MKVRGGDLLFLHACLPSGNFGRWRVLVPDPHLPFLSDLCLVALEEDKPWIMFAQFTVDCCSFDVWVPAHRGSFKPWTQSPF